MITRIFTAVATIAILIGLGHGQANAASVQEDQAALAALGSNVGVAVTVGSLGGTIAGAGIGCVVGGVVIPAVGCIPGAVTGAGIGAVAGTIVAGGPTLAIMGVETYNTITAAPGTTKWVASN